MSGEPWVRIDERTWEVPSYPSETGHSQTSLTVKVRSSPGMPMIYPLWLSFSDGDGDGDESVGDLVLSKREVQGLVQVLLDAMAQADDTLDWSSEE